MNKKRLGFIVVLMTLCLVLARFGVSVVQATDGTEPTITISSVEGNAGETVDVTLTVSNNPGVAIIYLEVGYDKDLMTLLSITDGGLLGTNTNNASEGIIYCQSPNFGGENITANGILATLTFQLSEDIDETKSCEVTASYDIDNGEVVDKDFNPIEFNIVNGTVTIKAPEINVEPIALENGAVAIERAGVKYTEGVVPTCRVDGYKDYLFAGWFTASKCTLDTAIEDVNAVGSDSYAKFIPADILSVMAQVSTDVINGGTYDGKWAMRLISSVESLNYKNVGFKVTYKDNTSAEPMGDSSNMVYEKIKSVESENAYNFSPSVISLNSEYFITAKLPVEDTSAAKVTDYVIQAFIETLDGTFVYGPSRILCFNDSNNTSINLTVNATEQLSGTGYTATYGLNGTESSATAVTVLSSDANGYSNVRITLDASALKSATRVIIKDAEGNVVGNEIYRNYYTTHIPTSGTTAVADTTWYDVNPEATQFVIASSADLYGLTSLVNGGTDVFLDDTITLVRDIEVNKGTAVSAVLNEDGTIKTAAKWEPANADETVYSWTGPGLSKTYYFDGTFDGDGNTISGLYCNYTKATLTADYEAYIGLFGRIEKNASVINTSLTNSYFSSNGIYMGMIAYGYGVNLHNLYCDAIFVANSQTWQSGGKNYPGGYVGGILGRRRAIINNVSTSPTQSMSNCWFDGEIYANDVTNFVGGMVGQLFQSGNFVFENCLNTGFIHTTHASTPYAGGLFGETQSKTNTTIKNCLDTGKIVAPNAVTMVGGLFSRICGEASNVTITNTYTISDLTLAGTATARDFNADATGTLTQNSMVKSVSELQVTTEAELLELFPLLDGETETPWKCNLSGTPTLK